jgi:threonyl-tRNA synthetase
MKDEEKLAHIRHSVAHLLAAAVLEFYPDTKNTIGPAIDNGFYYDFEFGTPITDTDLPKINKKMREIIKSWKDFSHTEVPADEARKYFAHNPYKLELIDEIVAKGEKITLYTAGAGTEHEFTDLCRGGHVENPAAEIKPDSFKITHLAGAYWRGDEKNKMLTRIYGLAFESKDALDAYETMLVEAEKRDHKKLGRELDLFTFSDLVGSGLPLWTPRGTLMRNILDDYVWELRRVHGYEKVEIPHITKKELYEKSGHWDKFKDELFKITTREGHIFAMKPMNCPHHTQIFARRKWSYRDMPQRYANTTVCYRDEQTGELSGLSRVRALTQDDAHVFCRNSQVKEEILRIWDIIHTFYGTFGFTLRLRLSLHDPAYPEKYLGDPARWKNAENILREIAKEKQEKKSNHTADFIEAIGEAAFYGPKLDFMANDSLGREWQVATIQLDMNMPERFELECTNEEGVSERIVMIHAAIMGSIERFLSILIEHYAGNFPLWLAPEHVVIIPVGSVKDDKQNGEAHHKEAALLYESLRSQNIGTTGIRARVELSDVGFGKKIRSAKMSRAPYFVIIGDKDIAAGKVTLESRDHGQIGQITKEDLITRLIKEIKEKK